MAEKSMAFDMTDRFCGSMIGRFHFNPSARHGADVVLAKEPADIFSFLINDRESEVSFLVAKHVLDATLGDAGPAGELVGSLFRDESPQVELLLRWIEERRNEIVAILRQALSHGPEGCRAVLRERAAVSLLGDCWLDLISQPATQPAEIVNRLFSHRWRMLGNGTPARSATARRRKAIEAAGIFLPEVADAAFQRETGMTRATALHAAFLLALARFPANYLPEVVGTHVVCHLIGVDDLVTDVTAVVEEREASEILTAFFDLLDDAPQRGALSRRLVKAIAVVLALEHFQATLLAEVAAHAAGQSLERKVAEIVRRHAPFAGKQHGAIKVGGTLLSDRFVARDFDAAAFLSDFRRSPFVKARPNGRCRFLEALRFGGPMFGIFSEDEARILKAWIEQIGDSPPAAETATRDWMSPGDEMAAKWLFGIRQCSPRGLVFEEQADLDDRSLFHRLVNFENYPNVLPSALERARAALERATILFDGGGHGRYTDPSFFDYSPERLCARIESIYWNKLVNPYAPLAQVPPRDEVIFGQKVFALGSLIDGSWAFRSGGTGHYERSADGMLFSIYADEMGRGDLRKNHIVLIHRVLSSLEINLPHIRDEAFIDQDEIPDDFYAFPLNQLCLGLFPDALYPEILGYNLGIEMFGLGELRLHEMQKLRHWGFDDSYERVHLSIDNLSAGHARQSAAIIQSHLDETARRYGAAAAAAEWRRVWNGYAVFSYFVEGENLEPAPTAISNETESYSVINL
ncbi:MAG: iron-containing redox enzyme family protein [Sulfurifustaceae bacterium]